MGKGHGSRKPLKGGGSVESPLPRTSAAAAREIRTMEHVEREAHRLFWRIDGELDQEKPRRVIGELIDRQLKALRLLGEVFGARELRAELDKAMASNRELAKTLAGMTGGSTVLRADAAPPFVPANEGDPN